MLREPRGYPRSCVNVLLLPPTDPTADAGFVIMEQSALYATMSGTNLMVVTTVLLETGLLTQTEPVDDSADGGAGGTDRCPRAMRGGRVTLVEFDNVPSFATAVDVPVEVPGFGTVPVSVAWGGMACAVVDADALGLELAPDQARALGEAMIAVCGAAREQIGFRHPLNDELAEIEAAVVIGRPHDPRNHARQTCRHTRRARWTRRPAERVRRPEWPSCTPAAHSLSARSSEPKESWAASSGAASPARRDRRDAGIVPRIGGRAWITGYARYVLQDDDPFPEGFVHRGHLARREHRFRRGAPRRGPEARTGLTVVLRYFPSAAMKPIAAKPAPIPIRSQAAKSPSRMPSPTPMQIPPTNAGPP